MTYHENAHLLLAEESGKQLSESVTHPGRAWSVCQRAGCVYTSRRGHLCERVISPSIFGRLAVAVV